MKTITSTMALLVITGNVLTAGGNLTIPTIPIEPMMDMPKQKIVVIKDNVKYNGFYTGTAVSHMRMSEEITSSGYAITLMGGYYFNKFVGTEVRYMKTLSDLSIDSSRPIITRDDVLENVGLYVKPMYSLTTGFSFYGLAGYGKSTYSNTSGEYSESGFQWGIGAKYELANGVGLFIDYLDINDRDTYDTLIVPDIKFNATTVGGTYTF